MDSRITEKAANYVQNRHRRHWWQRIVSMFTCIVVFCTTYALILPAITMEGDELCGLETHTHTEDCYRVQPLPPEFVCNPLPLHTHDAGCENQSCGKADYLFHTHTDICRDSDGNLLCALPEILPHSHADECYTTVETESTVAVPHAHSDACYTSAVDYNALLCTLAETEGHAHSAECYGGKELCCTTAETAGHSHEPGCYGTALLICLNEDESHQHEDDCYGEAPLICGKSEQEPHSHDD